MKRVDIPLADFAKPYPPAAPRPFAMRHPVNYQQHKRRIETMLAEGLHDGQAWKPEAHDRYAELEGAGQRQRVTGFFVWCS